MTAVRMGNDTKVDVHIASPSTDPEVVDYHGSAPVLPVDTGNDSHKGSPPKPVYTNEPKRVADSESEGVAMSSSADRASPLNSPPGEVGVDDGTGEAEDDDESAQTATKMREQFLNTKLCPHYAKGHCNHGIGCTYAHSEAELRPLPDLEKTKLCESVTRGIPCRQGNCTYAHNRDELRATGDLVAYKTSLCRFNGKNRCLNGDKCRFAHGTEELRARVEALEEEYQVTPGGHWGRERRSPRVHVDHGHRESLSNKHNPDVLSRSYGSPAARGTSGLDRPHLKSQFITPARFGVVASPYTPIDARQEPEFVAMNYRGDPTVVRQPKQSPVLHLTFRERANGGQGGANRNIKAQVKGPHTRDNKGQETTHQLHETKKETAGFRQHKEATMTPGRKSHASDDGIDTEFSGTTTSSSKEPSPRGAMLSESPRTDSTPQTHYVRSADSPCVHSPDASRTLTPREAMYAPCTPLSHNTERCSVGRQRRGKPGKAELWQVESSPQHWSCSLSGDNRELLWKHPNLNRNRLRNVNPRHGDNAKNHLFQANEGNGTHPISVVSNGQPPQGSFDNSVRNPPDNPNSITEIGRKDEENGFSSKQSHLTRHGQPLRAPPYSVGVQYEESYWPCMRPQGPRIEEVAPTVMFGRPFPYTAPLAPLTDAEFVAPQPERYED